MELIIVSIALSGVLIVLTVGVLIKLSKKNENRGELEEMRRDISRSLAESRQETLLTTTTNINSMGDMLHRSQETLQKTVSESLNAINERFRSFALQNEHQLSDMRSTMERRLVSIQEDNSRRLDQMRETVDEKLQKTLEERIGQSFKLVSERLEQVYKGLGEMRTLATGVGDLKRVLSNVKTRGTLGEIQLGAILDEMLSPEQFEKQFILKEGSRERVDYAVKMPADDGESLYLPIDAKFPLDAYNKLIDAYDRGNPAEVLVATSELNSRIKAFAKDMSEKYINPPRTTDFAVMFLPVEGLYAEVVRSGLMEQLQREYKVTVSGPTTMSALLNSLQMGFRTLAIQKRSSEVWKVLGAVKTEFYNFGDVLAMTRRRLNQANDELDKLVGVRTRQIQRKLKDVEALPIGESERILLGETSETTNP
ncbi:MAG: DNA recombination protein RmuC [Ruminococcaceae bacterium]|nr:DNA recombination protein RmuC [Oscillospiraceae bacterium]